MVNVLFYSALLYTNTCKLYRMMERAAVPFNLSLLSIYQSLYFIIAAPKLSISTGLQNKEVVICSL